MITGHAEDPLFENKYPIYDKKFNIMEMEKAPTPLLMENPHQREIMTRFAALNHPEISRAYWWQGLSDNLGILLIIYRGHVIVWLLCQLEMNITYSWPPIDYYNG